MNVPKAGRVWPLLPGDLDLLRPAQDMPLSPVVSPPLAPSRIPDTAVSVRLAVQA